MLTMTGDTVSGGLMSNDNPGTVVLVVGGSYSNCVVVLDGFIFFASKFSKCVFIYRGPQ